jgi:hypothetical protein
MCVCPKRVLDLHSLLYGTEEALTPAPFLFMSPSPGDHWYISGTCTSNTYSVPWKRVTLRISSRETGSVNLKPGKSTELQHEKMPASPQVYLALT